MNTEQQEFVEALLTLGSTVDEVYNSLVAYGIKGKKQSRCNCPIANYLKSKFPQYNFGVTINRSYAYPINENTYGDCWVYEIINPLAVGIFIDTFDGHLFSREKEKNIQI